MLAMTESLKEIIRVLQLTSPTEEQGALASSTGGLQTGLPGGILPGTLAAKVFEAKSLLGKTGMYRNTVIGPVYEEATPVFRILIPAHFDRVSFRMDPCSYPQSVASVVSGFICTIHWTPATYPRKLGVHIYVHTHTSSTARLV